jgi:hypothetical protein
MPARQRGTEPLPLAARHSNDTLVRPRAQTSAPLTGEFLRFSQTAARPPPRISHGADGDGRRTVTGEPNCLYPTATTLQRFFAFSTAANKEWSAADDLKLKTLCTKHTGDFTAVGREAKYLGHQNTNVERRWLMQQRPYTR